MSSSPSSHARAGWPDLALFFALACGITWLVDLPLVLAWLGGRTPPDYALPLAGLGAFGPTLAALIVAGRRHELRGVFGRWRCNPLWIVLALFGPGLLHLVATLIEVALGGSPAQWFYPPNQPELVAALIVFSIGEEFGWRGYAYPRLTALHGPVAGSLILGFVWGVWHLAMSVTPEGTFDPLAFAIATVELMLASVVFAWVFERGNRSMAVAFAFHAGAHLDNVNHALETEVRLRVLRFVVFAIAAAFAARALARGTTARQNS
jgi:membrane protease YdiL (CAAX protease family)